MPLYYVVHASIDQHDENAVVLLRFSNMDYTRFKRSLYMILNNNSSDELKFLG